MCIVKKVTLLTLVFSTSVFAQNAKPFLLPNDCGLGEIAKARVLKFTKESDWVFFGCSSKAIPILVFVSLDKKNRRGGWFMFQQYKEGFLSPTFYASKYYYGQADCSKQSIYFSYGEGYSKAFLEGEKVVSSKKELSAINKSLRKDIMGKFFSAVACRKFNR